MKRGARRSEILHCVQSDIVLRTVIFRTLCGAICYSSRNVICMRANDAHAVEEEIREANYEFDVFFL